MTKLCFDYDPIIYKACCAVETRSIKVTNKTTGKSKVFKNRTEFYGHYKNKKGGWLAKQRLEGSEFTVDDYLIEDVTEAKPVGHALKIIKETIQGYCDSFWTEDYYGYAGGRNNFRKDLATLFEYKGNRNKLHVPKHLDAARDYVLKYHKAKSPMGREVDDMVCRDAYTSVKEGKALLCIVGEKDFKGCEGDFFYTHENKSFIQRGFGKLERTPDNVKGIGRIFKYWQVCSQDDSDNYFAHCFSDFTNGPVTAYEALKDCKNDTEAFIAMKKHFQYLYPEPKVVKGWRGNEIEIDWLYVMQEMFHLAHLERWEGDRINVKEVFNKLGIEL